jgi:hypothetical protein
MRRLRKWVLAQMIHIDTMAERCYTAVKSVQQFDNLEVRPRIQTLVNRSDRDNVFVGSYWRAAGNVESLVQLNNVKHVQGIAMLARALFELAVDVRLINIVPDAVAKVWAFSDLEKLRAARKIIKFKTLTGASFDTKPHETLIAKEELIEAAAKALWSGVKLSDIRHWSAKGLSERAALLPGKLHQFYELEYARLSWFSHSGLTGFAGVDAKTLSLTAAYLFWLAVDCHEALLTATINEFELEKVDPKVIAKLTAARMLPFTDGAEQAGDIWNELVGLNS